MNTAAPRSVAALAILLLSAVVSGAGVVITEFVASNHTGLRDEDGDRPDWIELYNTGPDPVNLDGWHLTDRASNPSRWTFPAVRIEPGQYLVIFASGKNRTDVDSPLHTSFSLSAGGEYLALTNRSGSVVHAYPPARQWSDVSQGLLDPADPAGIAYFLRPTPGRGNNVSFAAADPPEISPPDGTFTESLEITLTTGEAAGVIRYTLDNTDPVESSPDYTRPIAITGTTRLRARTFVPGRMPSPVSSGVWIHLSPELADPGSNLPLMIVESFNSGRPQSPVTAHWMVMEPEARSRVTLQSPVTASTRARIRVRGASTADADKYSLAVEAQNESGFDRAIRLEGFPEAADWILHAPYEYDRSLIRNPLMYELSRHCGLYAVRTRQVELYLNVDGGSIEPEDYVGVYTLMERIERGDGRVEIARIRSGDTHLPEISGGYIFKVDRPGPLESGFAAAAQRLYWVEPKEENVRDEQRLWLTNYLDRWWAATRSGTFFDPVTGYARYIDPDSFATFHILNVMSKSVDALRLSAYYTKDRHERVRAGPLWDFDRSMDSLDPRDDNFDTWRGETLDGGADYFGIPWYAQLFRDPNFWQRWIDRYAELRAGPLSDEAVHAAISWQAAELAEAAPRNFARWPEVAPRFGGWTGEINHLETWLRNRLNWMDAQFTRPPVADRTGGHVERGTVVTLTSPSLAKPGVKIFYTTDGTDPRPFDDTQGQEVLTHTLVSRTSPVRAHIPLEDPGTAWRTDPDWDDSGWIAGTGGAGFDDDADFDPYIGINLEPPPERRRMKNVSPVCLLRYRFSLTQTQIDAIRLLKLRIRYDDGFVAWVNGVRMAASNAPGEPAWDSPAVAQTTDEAAITQEDFNMIEIDGVLRPGTNLLAIQGLNFGAGSGDFLIQAELYGAHLAIDGPEFSPSAIEYTGPLTIAETTHLFARAWDPDGPYSTEPNTGEGAGKTPVGSRWSAPFRASYLIDTVPAGPGHLRIEEIMYHPAGPFAAETEAGYTNPAAFEFVEIRNVSTETLDLTEVRIGGDIQTVFADGPLSVLGPDRTVLVARDPGALALRYGTELPVGAVYTGELPDSSGSISLRSREGVLIQEVRYGSRGSWPSEPDGRGPSLEYRASVWLSSLDPGGTPAGLAVGDYPSWQRRHFANPASAQAQPGADPDRDGIPNALEFAFGALPGVPDARMLPSLDESGTVLTATRRSGLNAQWIIETSADMSSWRGIELPETVTPLPNGTERVSWPLQLASTPGPRFYRIRVILP